mmetsp:Transcript_32749/g.105807  ORF Transcript_32749/g.105807 Transcript_32749/m.105807 type:complete len:255 (+) Transcript_32749:1940-2704(+)
MGSRSSRSMIWTASAGVGSAVSSSVGSPSRSKRSCRTALAWALSTSGRSDNSTSSCLPADASSDGVRTSGNSCAFTFSSDVSKPAAPSRATMRPTWSESRSVTISSSCEAESGEKTLSRSALPGCSCSVAVTRTRTRFRPRTGDVSQRARCSSWKRALVRTDTTRSVSSAARISRGSRRPAGPPSIRSACRTAASLSTSSRNTITGCGRSRREPTLERSSVSHRGGNARRPGSESAASSASSVASHCRSSVVSR